jgi:ABC-type Zn uptake system ZnuABC Zn-binding protein ZnuA
MTRALPLAGPSRNLERGPTLFKNIVRFLCAVCPAFGQAVGPRPLATLFGAALALSLWVGPFFVPLAFAAFEPIPVVATLPVLADFVRQVGGPHVQVRSLISGLDNEHTYAPKPGDVLAVRRARLLVQIGLGLETWVADLVQNADRPDLPVITTSDGIATISSETDPPHKEAGASHPEVRGNVHVWLDPENAKTMVGHIADGLIRVDPAHKADYLARQAAYRAALDRWTADVVRQMASLHNRKMVTYHPAWPYFARRFGFEIGGEILQKGGREPSLRQMKNMIDTMRREKIGVIVSEPQLDPRLPELLAKETGARVVILSTLTGAIPQTDTYLDLMRYNTQTLIAALAAPAERVAP